MSLQYFGSICPSFFGNFFIFCEKSYQLAMKPTTCEQQAASSRWLGETFASKQPSIVPLNKTNFVGRFAWRVVTNEKGEKKS
eukprot:scaffold82_cov135-Skeletonema_menzelii.AAC.3